MPRSFSQSLTTIWDCSSMSLADPNNQEDRDDSWEVPRESMQGGEVWSLELGEVCMGRVMRKSE